MKKFFSLLITLTVSGVLFGPVNVHAQNDCIGYRTQTQGGWGAPANGNNNGAYRNAHFDNTFPNGLVIGCEMNKLTLSTSLDVQDFLPCGGPAVIINEDYLNPNCIQNVYASHLIALTLNVYFDLNDEDFSVASGNLGDLIIGSGSFEGITVYAFLDIANNVFGSCSQAYTAKRVTNALASINENFVDGTINNGYLLCGEECLDILAPVVTYLPDNDFWDCNQNEALDVPIFSDEDTDLDIVFTQSQVGDGCAAVITHTWVATDDCGNSTTVTQTVNVSDVHAPSFADFPLDISIQCHELQALSLPEAWDWCNDVVVTAEESLLTTECVNEYTLLRTYTCTDACGNAYTQIHTILVADTLAPTFNVTLPAIIMNCGEELEEFEVSASDHCAEFVELVYSESIIGNLNDSTCTLSNPEMLNPNWALILLGMPNGADHYIVQTGSFLQNDDMTALVAATLVCTTNPNAGWHLQVNLINGLDWNQWSNQDFPTGYKDDMGYAGDNYLDWLYYIIDPASSHLIGWGDYEGSTMSISHIPVNYFYGYQVGLGANNVSAEYGHGGWMMCTGNFTDASQNINQFLEVAGDFAFEQLCCVAPSILRTWTATDECGNVGTLNQMVYIQDTTAPVFTSFPNNSSYQCGEEIVFILPVAFDLCSEFELTFVDSIITTDCISEYTLLRTYTATDVCGNALSQTQTISILDNLAPVLSDYPQDVILACGEAFPAIPAITATDNCDELIAVDFEEIIIGDPADSTCTLSNPEVLNPNWALILLGMPNGADYYLVQTGSFLQNDDMTALVTATLVCTTNPNAGWHLQVNLINGLDWNQWSNQDFPTGYKDDMGYAGDNYLDWLYYIIDPASSHLIGWGDYEGSALTISHIPVNYFYGYQVGLGANNVSAEYGHGGWMMCSGYFVDASQNMDLKLEVSGDFAFEQTCCSDVVVQRTWSAIDCAGNASSHVQTISFSDTDILEAKNRDLMPEAISSSIYPNPFSEIVNLNFSEPQEQIDVTVYSVSGAIVSSHQVNGSDKLAMNLSRLETGVYIMQVSSSRGNSVHRLLKQ